MHKFKWLVVPALILGVCCSILFLDRPDSRKADPEMLMETKEGVDPEREPVCDETIQAQGKQILSETVYGGRYSKYRKYPFDVTETKYLPPDSFYESPTPESNYESPLHDPENEVYFVSVSALKLPNNQFYGGGGCYLVTLRRADCAVVDIQQTGCRD